MGENGESVCKEDFKSTNVSCFYHEVVIYYGEGSMWCSLFHFIYYMEQSACLIIPCSKLIGIGNDMQNYSQTHSDRGLWDLSLVLKGG